MRSSEAPRTLVAGSRLLRLVLLGAAAAAVVFGLGRAAEWAVLGRSPGDAAARIEAASRRSLEEAVRALDAAAGTVGMAVRNEGSDAVDDPAARERLFASAARAVDGRGEIAVTAYAGAARVLAWAGRPSEHDARDLDGPPWAVTRSALGPRLRRVRPVRSPDGLTRTGTVVAELPLAGRRGSGPAVDAAIILGDDSDLAVRFAVASVPPAPGGFILASPTGTPLLVGTVVPEEVATSRARWRAGTTLLAAMTFALAGLLALGRLLARRARATALRAHLSATLLVLMILVGLRLLLAAARPSAWRATPVFGDDVYASLLLSPLFASPFDFVLTGLAAGAVAALLLSSLGAWRRRLRAWRRPVRGPAAWLTYLVLQLVAGGALAAILLAQRALLADTVAHAATDLLRFSLHPWDPARLTLQGGLVIWHGVTVGFAVAVLRAAALPWRLRRGSRGALAASVAAWLAPVAAVSVLQTGVFLAPVWIPALAVVLPAAWLAARVAARYRRGSQALRLSMLLVGVIAPALLAYPIASQLTREARAALIAERYTPQALEQRNTIQGLLRATLGEIDRLPDLPGVFAGARPGGAVDPAFEIWRRTQLAAYPMTSSVELHAADGVLFSRYAFNLPDDLVAPPTWSEVSCAWAIFEEVSPFFADERRMLHAGRAVCGPDGAPLGSIVVHALPDNDNLPFIASANPYLEFIRATDPLVGEGLPAEGLRYAVYGWSRTPLYSSAGRAWLLPDDVFARVEVSRDPVWARLARDGRPYDVHFVNDRFGIYALGLPVATPLEHLVNLAELIVLAAGTFLLLLGLTVAARRAGGGALAGRALIREVRASFYRRLFLAFVAVTVVPVVILAVVTRTYVAGELRVGVEEDAVRSALAARRVVEDLAAPRAAQQGIEVDDNLMVWVSRLIDQDVNIFSGETLLATSERNLFAGGLLPTRTPADLYRSVVLAREGAAVSLDRIGPQEYMVAATPLPLPSVDAILTVPLTSQQQAIEGQIDTLDRRVLLTVLILIFGSAGIGYSMAERIADPVNRLTRATRALARGDLGVRITPTSSDELRRLMQDFNRMAGELQRQRGELERRHRLAAWAEMASQVAHEIKNPLTPIQLHAEHLRRVHEDRGAPLGPVVRDSTETILEQVTLLRRIASDFSTFAASPTAQPGRVAVPALLEDVLGPYRRGLVDRVHFAFEAPARVPDVFVDRTLVARALTNVVENAVHAMPGTGTLTVRVSEEPGMVCVAFADTGVGMDGEALARAFEPSFSTKMTGTGLGLPIAKRNVELSHGVIGVASTPGHGTTVTVKLPTVDSTGARAAGR